MQSGLDKSSFPRFNGLTIGRVYHVYPEANMVDVLLFEGTKLEKVQCMVPYASSRAGVVSLPKPKYDEVESMLDRESPFKPATQNESDVVAVVAFVGGSVLRPLVLGFLFPEENEILCNRTEVPGNEKGTMFLWKHESNTYVKVTEKGNSQNSSEIEISHPSGLFIKIGNTITSDTISNYDKALRPFNKLDSETKEAEAAPYMHIQHPSGTYITVDPEGAVTEYVYGKVKRTFNDEVEEEYKAKVTRTYSENVAESCKKDWDKTVDGILSDTGRPVHHNNTE